MADTPQSTVILNTVSSLVKQAPNGPSTKPVARCTGAGVMDTSVAYEAKTGLIASTLTWSAATPNNNNSYMQGALALSSIDAVQGLTNAKFIELPALNGDRPYMRPNVAIGSNFIVTVFASEDNGVNNGNPQVVAWVFDKQGNMLTISNTNRGAADKPINLITLTGNNDDQQYGPHSILSTGTESDGTESFILGVQRNNQQAQVLKFGVKVDSTGAATFTPYYRKTIIQNAQHNRVSLAIPPDFVAHNHQVVATAVEANTQPADIGVRAVLVDTDTGSKIASTLIAQSDPNNNMYAVQPTVQYINDSLVTIAYQMSAGTKNGDPNNRNGHGQGENVSNLSLLKIPTSAGQPFVIRDTANRTAPYQRHAEAFGMLYGTDDAANPAVGAIGGSATGMGKALVQVIPIDVVNEKLGAIDPMKMYQVSNYSDVAMLPARGKRNPNNQARGFIRGIYGVVNPGYGNPSGFMPEVKYFSLSSVAGLVDPQTTNRDSLFFSLIPAVWTHSVATVPGQTVPSVPPGPSQVATPPAQGGPTPTNPGVTSTGGDTSGGAGGMPSVPSTPGGTSAHAPGFSATDGTAAGCACTTAPGSSSTNGLAGLSILAMGLALLGIRRGKKQEA